MEAVAGIIIAILAALFGFGGIAILAAFFRLGGIAILTAFFGFRGIATLAAFFRQFCYGATAINVIPTRSGTSRYGVINDRGRTTWGADCG